MLKNNVLTFYVTCREIVYGKVRVSTRYIISCLLTICINNLILTILQSLTIAQLYFRNITVLLISRAI